MMTAIMVFVLAFGVGCLTGVAVRLLSRERRVNDAARTTQFGALRADD
jgi:hypothetical protein